jgi:hypothetical protein
MKRINLIKVFSWSVTHISWMTMAFSPVALGEQAKNITANNLKTYAKEFGLNQKTTLSEFWAKSKFYFPGHMYKDIESFVEKNPNLQMPQLDIKTTKSSDGTEIPTIFFTENGKTQTIQIFGESEKFIKFNGVMLTEKETELPQKMFKKLMAADPKLKADYEKNQKQQNLNSLDELNRPFKDFSGLPRFNKALWSAMTLKQRAAYIVEMRLLNEKADDVQRTKLMSDAKNKKTSSFNYFKKIDAAWSFLVGEDLVALPAFSGVHCINQGFIADDNKSYNRESYNYRTNKKGKPLAVEACNLESILKTDKYKSKSLIQTARAECLLQGAMPCNPLVYSFQPQTGKAFCSKPASDREFQAGTHFKGSCDSQARLSGEKTPNKQFIDASAEGLRKESEQGIANNKGKDLTKLNHDEVKKLLEESQAKDSFAATNDYLLGMLKAKDKNELQKLLSEKKWTPELESEILGIQKAFEDNIKESMNLCSVDLKDPKQTHESNYRDACEQLHRRWLFSQKIIDQLKCKDGTSPVVGSDGKKACATPPVPVVVIEPVKPVEPKVEDKPSTCETEFPGASGLDKDCKCEKSKEIPTIKEQGFFAKMFHKKKSETLEYECKSDGINWWLVGGILGGIGLLALLFRHKNKDTNTTCTNGGAPPDCIVPSACSNGGVMPNCQLPTVCANGGTPPTCSVTSTCSNGGVPPLCTLPTSCQGNQQFINGQCQCPNVCAISGSSQNALSCACSAPPNEGGTGTNTCANPPCSGGVPTGQ